MKKATVYKKGGYYYMHATSLTCDGFGIATNPFKRVEENEGKQSVMQMLFKVLEGSRKNVKQPRDIGQLKVPLLELAGVKSWNTFSRGASCCLIGLEDNILKVIPTKPERGGFVPLLDQENKIDINENWYEIFKILEFCLA